MEKQKDMIMSGTTILFKKPEHRHKDVSMKVLGRTITLCKKCSLSKIGYYEETAIYLKFIEKPSPNEVKHE